MLCRVIEIALFIKSSQWIGLLPTIALAIGAGAVGIAMVRALPPVRVALRLWLAGHMRGVVVAAGRQPPRPPGQPPVIEGDFTVVERNDDQLPR